MLDTSIDCIESSKLNFNQVLKPSKPSIISCREIFNREKDSLITEEKKWKRSGYKCVKINDKHARSTRHRRN